MQARGGNAAARGGEWVRAIGLADLRARGRAVVRIGARRIALFDVEGAVHAVDNRCPHEGYPLAEGSLDADCVLTCNWHNWKFELATGRNLLDGEGVRTWPVEVRGDAVWIDAAEPPAEARRAGVVEGLREAFDDNDYERVAREVARLAHLGGDPLDALAVAVDIACPRMEYGWTHALAGAADWLVLHDEDGGAERRLVCVVEAIGHLADDVVREPRRAFPRGAKRFDEDAFVAAIEAEDEALAARMVRGALRDGLGWASIERAFVRAALAHYVSFGHALIYCTKAGPLLERLGPGAAEPVLLALVRHLVYAWREDLVPEFRRYRPTLARFGARAACEPPAARDYRGLGVNRALALTARHAGTPPAALYAALLGANARNLLAFDLRHATRTDGPVGANVGWLDFTHGITFANAVRIACTRHPGLWPAGLLQMACFAGRNARFADFEADRSEWTVEDGEAFFAGAVERLHDHGVGEFIVSVHLVKSVLAARAEWRWSHDPAIPAAVNRFLSSPMKRRHARRTVRQAMRFARLQG